MTARAPLVARNDDEARRCAQPRVQRRRVERPRDSLFWLARLLHIDDDAVHGAVVEEREHEVGAPLGRRQLREIGVDDAHLAVRGDCDVEEVAQKRGDYIMVLAREEEGGFVPKVGHRTPSIDQTPTRVACADERVRARRRSGEASFGSGRPALEPPES